jgi:lipoprotein-releasing system permease protein
VRGNPDFSDGGRNLPLGIEARRRGTDLFADRPGPDDHGAERGSSISCGFGWTIPLIAQKVATRVEAQIGYRSVSWQEANSDLLSNFATRDFIVLTVMGAMLLSSSFATYNIISTITHEKRHDIAIMKSLGMREYSVRRIFIIESMMMGFGWNPVGWLLGYLLCYAWSLITIFNPLTGATVPLRSTIRRCITLPQGAIAILCCAVAAFFPARKATRVHPVEIIRGAS